MKTPHDIPALLAKATGMDPISASLTDYKSLFDHLATGHIFSTIIPRGGFWYRVRKNSGATLYHHTRELWYPPAERISKLGRANEPNKPVLYLSEDGGVAIRETDFNDGDLLTIIECEVVPPSMLRLQEIGVFEGTAKKPLVSLSDTIKGRLLGAHRQGYGHVRNQQLVRDFFVREFTRRVDVGQEHGYKASVALSSILMSRQDCDGIVYPAMRSKMRDVNLALKPSSADSKLRVRRADVVEAHKLPDGEIAVRRLFVSSAINADGSIVYDTTRGRTSELPWVSAKLLRPAASE